MNPAPMNPPPVNSSAAHPLMRALSGPLLLTTLGVLLTIDYMGGINFGRSWPVLLIVFGLCKVAEYVGPRGL
jgi:cell wall-active antibiotic response 4TMS protein YvqF